ncbi:MAG TPA: ATP-dependent zinc protease [Marinobacter sp.]|nr:ATP-dependent zinc protease [Marinobacter sp.]
MSTKAVEETKAVMPAPDAEKISLGWREWVALPGLGISKIKAKVDTGARTSCLHTFRTEPYTENGERRVRFWVHPVQNDMHQVVECDAKVLDERTVSDSGGHKELRVVIETTLVVGDKTWPIEMTLTNRDSMRFRMLLGRTAMSGRVIVYPEASYLAGDPIWTAES